MQTNFRATGCAYIDDYAEGVLNGSILTDEITQRCVTYHLKMLALSGVIVDNRKIERARELIEKYFGFELTAWERYVLGLIHAYKDDDVLFRKFLIVMGTGNGKNGFISGLVWYFTTPDHGVMGYNIDIIANSEDQAETSFKDISEMMDTHWAKMRRQFSRSKVVIENRRTRSYIKYNTTGAKTKAGKRSACLVYDEVYMYTNYGLINELEASFGKRPHSRIIMITSQGLVREGVLDSELAIAEDVLNGEREDLRLCPLVYRVSSEEEVRSPDCWVKANPSYYEFSHLRKAIAAHFAEIDTDSEKEANFYTKRMSFPKQNRELLVATHKELMAASEPIETNLNGKDCVAGIDYALLSDMASVGLLFRAGEKRYWIQHSYVCRQSADWMRINAPLERWHEKGDLTIVNDVQIFPQLLVEWLVSQMQKYNILKLALDLARFALLREALMAAGFHSGKDGNIHFVRPLGVAAVSPVIESWFRTGSIKWGDVPLMRWATNNTKRVRMKTENASGNYKYDKIEPRSRKTDPFMALAHAATLDSCLDAAAELSSVWDLPDSLV